MTPPGHAARIAGALATVAREEGAWLLHGDRHDPLYLPWMPFQWADFTALLAECAAEAAGPAFIDVGCGVGTKMLIAAELLGLDAHGVERDPGMAAYARERQRGTTWLADALELPQEFWGAFDIVWMYRPFRDSGRQARLEQRVYAGMRPGAILAGGALEAFPRGWLTVVDDLDAGRGAFRKP